MAEGVTVHIRISSRLSDAAYPNGAPLGRPIELVGWLGVRDGRTELRKATGFWMGLGVELLEVGEEA